MTENNELEKKLLDESLDSDYDKIKVRDISAEMKESFLDYSMSVIVARALPDVRDGMKPVQRRIIYAMSNIGLTYDRPHRKSAKVVGDVMGEYHPHGDSAIYSAMVRMAQPFSYRYPLVDGQGNFGNIDGWPAASMRYTEARLMKLSNELVKDINKNTVDFTDNYSNETKEPTVLPSRMPNLLLNGSMGIAVGMATNIPPHNLNEVVDATIALIDNSEISIIELMQNHLFGPDFPTGSYILGRSGIKKAYMTGKGQIIQRGKAEIDTLPNGKPRIVITQIPYQVVKAQLVEKIGQLVREKQIEGITDLRDESSKKTGIRVVIECRKDVSGEVILNQLYRLTPLQSNFSANMIALVNGEPRLLNLKQMLQLYLDHQVDVIYRKTKYDLERALERAHILEGFMIALDNIDEVIHIIRNSQTDNEAQQRLLERFNLTPVQSKAILDMRLRRLTGLERDKIQNEYQQLLAMIEDYRDILNNHYRVLDIIKTDLLEIKEKYGDARRSIIMDSGYDVDDEDLIERDEIVVSMTLNGYIKQTSVDEYKTQHRGGRGVKGMSTNDEDVVDRLLTMNTHDYICFFTNLGKIYRLKGYQVPSASRTSKGIPVVNLIPLEKDEKVKSMLKISQTSTANYAIFVTEQGIVKRTSVEEFMRVNKNGKIAIKLNEGDNLVETKATTGDDDILIASSFGKAVRFHESILRPTGRNSVGVRGMNVDGGKVIGMTTSHEGNFLLSVTENGYGKLTDINEYRLTNRGGKGVKTVNITQKNGPLVAFRSVNGNEDALIVTDQGILIRFSLNDVSHSGRATLGVKLINVHETKVASLAIVQNEDEEDKQDLS